MSSAKRAAMHVGRTGALAVALGVGAAVFAGAGVAGAETGTSADAGTSAERSAASPAGSTDSTGKTSARRSARPAPPASSSPANDSPAGERRVAVSPAAAALPSGENRTPVVNSPAPTAAASTASPQRPGRAPAPSASPVSVTPALPPAPDTEAVAPAAVDTLPAVAPVLAAPVAASAPVAARPAAMASVARLRAAVGLDPVDASSTPAVPADTALWALAAWTRRDRAAARTITPASSAQPTAATFSTAAVVATQPTSLTSTPVGWVTGQRNNAFPGAGWTQTNNTSWANVYGTDLGIMWFNGVNGLTQLAFGDTFSGPNMSGNWRSNVLLLSDDTKLYNGLSLINTGPANQFIPAARNKVFIIGSETTNIPTAAIYANGQNYVNYMSVKSWDTPGRWTTNYSAISMYNPDTDKWVLQDSTIRSAAWFRSTTRYRAGDQNFQQMAYVLQPESQVPEGGTRYLYAFGTPAGRTGSAYLSRVAESSITNLAQYEYWDGSTWVKDKPAVATAVIGTNKSSGLFGFIKDLANNPNFFGGWFAGLFGAKTGGNVSEMSVQYNEYLGKYVVLYGNGANNVILRTADTPEGQWSDPVTLATSIQYPGLYAPMIHPLSGTGQLTDAGDSPDLSTLYWNMSIWSNYNVVLMKTDLTPLKPVIV